ncbi:phosphatase PAP2 family protein [Streptomyces sp. NPDC054987]
MESNKRYGWGRRSAAAVVVSGAGVAGVAWAAPGGTAGADGAVHVTAGLSARAYRAVNAEATDGPAWLAGVLEAASEGTVLLLGLLLVWAAWSALRRKDVAGLAGAAVAAAGTVVAYGVSETLKVILDEERPCRALPGVRALVECPEPGDWSFPSNHSTLAVALAVGVTLVRPRLAFLALPVGAAAAALRVLVGVHYPHDVLAGTVLGTTTAVTLMLLLRTPAEQVVGRLGPFRDQAGPVRDHGRHRRTADARTHQGRVDVRTRRFEAAEHAPLPAGRGPDAGEGRATATHPGPRTSGGETRDERGRGLR